MNYDSIIELDNVTLQDCLQLSYMKGVSVIINDGHIVDFVKEDRNEV